MSGPQRADAPRSTGNTDASRSADSNRGNHSGPLAGARILLTRSEEDSTLWADALERLGALPVALPCIDAEPLGGAALAEALRAAADAADWLVFTSRRGVEAFVRLAGAGAGRSARVAVVGPATAEAAERSLGRVDLVGERGTAESLAESMIRAGVGSTLAGTAPAGRTPAGVAGAGCTPASITPAGSTPASIAPAGSTAASIAPAGSTAASIARGATIVLALAENARDVLERELGAAGATCRRFDVYRTIPAAPITPKLALSGLGVRAVWLASPSAVEGFVNQVDVDAEVPLIAIGPSTAAAIRARGLAVAAEARAPSFEGLLEATG